MGINFSALKKITMGFFTGAAAMVWAVRTNSIVIPCLKLDESLVQAVVQHYIYDTSACGYDATTCKSVSPLNVWIQTGSYVLIALSEILASITGLEYAFTKAPKNMKSLVMSVFLFANAISSAIGEAFVGEFSFPPT